MQQKYLRDQGTKPKRGTRLGKMKEIEVEEDVFRPAHTHGPGRRCVNGEQLCHGKALEVLRLRWRTRNKSSEHWKNGSAAQHKWQELGGGGRTVQVQN